MPKSPGMNFVGSKWVFKTKLKADGTIDRFKVLLVAMGFLHLEGMDFEEIFSLLVKATIISVVLSIVISLKRKIKQLEVKMCFSKAFYKRRCT